MLDRKCEGIATPPSTEAFGYRLAERCGLGIRRCRGPSRAGASDLKSPEHYGAVAVELDAAFYVPAYGAGQHLLFSVAAKADEFAWRHGAIDPRDVLFDDGAFFEVRRNVVRGRAEEPYFTGVGMMIRLRAFEAGQEAVVDVDRQLGIGGTRCGFPMPNGADGHPRALPDCLYAMNTNRSANPISRTPMARSNQWLALRNFCRTAAVEKATLTSTNQAALTRHIQAP